MLPIPKLLPRGPTPSPPILHPPNSPPVKLRRSRRPPPPPQHHLMRRRQPPINPHHQNQPITRHRMPPKHQPRHDHPHSRNRQLHIPNPYMPPLRRGMSHLTLPHLLQVFLQWIAHGTSVPVPAAVAQGGVCGALRLFRPSSQAPSVLASAFSSLFLSLRSSWQPLPPLLNSRTVSRLRRIVQADRFFFVTTNLARGVTPLSPGERASILEILDQERSRHQFFLHAYIVMPNHLHLLLDPGKIGLTNLMRNFKSKAALTFATQRHAQGPFWQPRFFDFICRRLSDFRNKLEYIHENPVSANLAVKPEDWPWSSAAWYLHRTNPPIPIDLADMPSDPHALLWPAPWR